MRRFRAFGLQPPVDAMLRTERTQTLQIIRRQRLQVTQVEHRRLIAHGHFDLRHAVGPRQATDQFAQRHQQGRHMRWQHQTGLHVGHVAAAPFAKAHQHAAFFGYQPHGQPGAMPVTEGRPLQRRQDLTGLHLADMLERIFQRTLLDGHLGGGLEVLHGTAPADAEMRTGRLGALRGWFQDALDDRLVEGGFATFDARQHAFSGQCAFGEDDLALVMGNPLTFEIQRLDIQGQQNGFNHGSRQRGILSSAAHRLPSGCRAPARVRHHTLPSPVRL